MFFTLRCLISVTLGSQHQLHCDTDRHSWWFWWLLVCFASLVSKHRAAPQAPVVSSHIVPECHSHHLPNSGASFLHLYLRGKGGTMRDHGLGGRNELLQPQVEFPLTGQSLKPTSFLFCAKSTFPPWDIPVREPHIAQC